MIKCFQNQTLKDFEVIFVVDSFNKMERWKDGNIEKLMSNIRFITNQNSDFIPWKWASYVRNYWISKAKWEFINLMDDDEDFWAEYLEKSVKLREKYYKIVWKKFILTPTLIYRKTWEIQSQWFVFFCPLLWKPIPYKLWKKQEYWKIKMFSCNSIFWPNEIFKKIKFDEKIDFEGEDLDFTYRINLSWYPIIVTKELELNHMEKNKTKLEKLRIWNPSQAYKKARHRILFVNKNCNMFQKIIFYCFWLWMFSFASIMRVLFLWKNTNKTILIKEFFRWIFWK